ncbi:NAD(P)/FAD-dependent oxidoreductase [Bradyrhizobium sp. WSM 1704]|uniref:NAD(P)/FAD-dependent oxidoreductase n=1 Tax=Bradyrhizobium semiaridum TaxID=2821404 RepID=UPI001CE2BC36|nr:NAD(P)/FAD-dependent oxidoreductase [Bradyrhizobium semiaridum]MCA6121349.1 NAD(P)/FAD-dependent oxidoreductase [Bradyrhizobium semiaridum]
MSDSQLYDVIVVGGGPAGSTIAWSLARRGVRVAIVERANFPREKVCGDFVEPAGLRILQAMGIREALEAATSSPITSTRIYLGPRLGFRGAIPYYQPEHGLLPHGSIIPRHVLDHRLLEQAEQASAKVYAGCAARGIRREDGLIHVDVHSADVNLTLRSRLIVGADGAESIVARSFNLEMADRAHISIAQRAYIEGVEVQEGEATVWFDEDIAPGYGWMFPMSGGRANVGVGILSESCHRQGHSVPGAFAATIERLKIRHPGCARVKLISKPIGGVVKMYGGAGSNYFDGGVLIGDAGAFADPMTGEGITQGMESALIASSTLLKALELGRSDAAFLANFERDFRRYFDPSMLFLSFCAAVMRNWHFREFWMRSSLRGCERAMADGNFARVAGAAFGGLNVHPFGILQHIGASLLRYFGEGTINTLRHLVSEGSLGREAMLGDLLEWQSAWKRSASDDPDWHAAWLSDLLRRAAQLGPTLLTLENPRIRGLSI